MVVFDCEMEVSAKNFRLSNSLLGGDLDGFTDLQVVKFKTGLNGQENDYRFDYDF